MKHSLFLVLIITLCFSCKKDNSRPAMVSSVALKSSPAIMNYFDGEVLDLSGLVVTLSMDNGKTEDVAFESFSDKGIVTLPANNTVLRKFIFLY